MRATDKWGKGARNHITPPNGMPLFAAMAPSCEFPRKFTERLDNATMAYCRWCYTGLDILPDKPKTDARNSSGIGR
jgi:hypothetical protein